MSKLARMTGKGERPKDRLGRIAAAMLEAAENHPESRDGDKAIVMLDDSEDMGMIAPGGYEDGRDAFVNLLAHLQVLAEANGLSLDFVPNARPIGSDQ